MSSLVVSAIISEVEDRFMDMLRLSECINCSSLCMLGKAHKTPVRGWSGSISEKICRFESVRCFARHLASVTRQTTICDIV